MVEITVSKDGKLTRVLRGEFCIAGVEGDDNFLTSIVGRAGEEDIVAAICTLAGRAAYEMAGGDRKAGKELLKVMEEGLKHIRKSPGPWRNLQAAEEIEEGAQNDRAQN